MKQLKELEEKIFFIVQKNKELQDLNNVLILENKELKEKCESMQAALSEKNKGFKDIEAEKDAIKNSIDELINTIGSFEKSYDKSVR